MRYLIEAQTVLTNERYWIRHGRPAAHRERDDRIGNQSRSVEPTSLFVRRVEQAVHCLHLVMDGFRSPCTVSRIPRVPPPSFPSCDRLPVIVLIFLTLCRAFHRGRRQLL